MSLPSKSWTQWLFETLDHDKEEEYVLENDPKAHAVAVVLLTTAVILGSLFWWAG